MPKKEGKVGAACLSHATCNLGFCDKGLCTRPSEYLSPCNPSAHEPCESVYGSEMDDEEESYCSNLSHRCLISRDDKGELDGGRCDTAANCAHTHYCPAVSPSAPSKIRHCQARKSVGVTCDRLEECEDGMECHEGYCRRRVKKSPECAQDKEEFVKVYDSFGVCMPVELKQIKVVEKPAEKAAEPSNNTALYWILGAGGSVVLLALLSFFFLRKNRKQ